MHINRGSTAMKQVRRIGHVPRPAVQKTHAWTAWSAAFRLCSWLCDEQGIVSQHCIASSGVDMARQSNAYIARAITITASKIGLAIRIRTKVGGSQSEVKGAKPPSANAN